MFELDMALQTLRMQCETVLTKIRIVQAQPW